ncbi:unnamed protein product [Moneuplotes crassus]|uniref:Aminopeptidase n=2 Tax=Euplotes crassus TaxID=5936 RepID=A0AAD2D7A0_EUPCR|nr:unnamed protein product [Moneuplotes crassus]
MEDFVKKNKIPLLVGAGALTALGLYKILCSKGGRCGKNALGFTEDPKFTENVPLYKEEAILRKKVISNVSYDLVLALRKGENFDGQILVTFDVNNEEFGEEELFIDYQGLGIKDLIINETSVDEGDAFNGQRIKLRRSLLKLGETNTLSVVFKSKYNKDGTGAHHFKDPEDENEYVYTQFEAFHCHRAFPAFDQPDLRAALTLRTLSPEDWNVISNGLEQGLVDPADAADILEGVSKDIIDPYDGHYKAQKYNPTPKIAPYLYAFVAGPYDFIETRESIPGRDEPLLMRLYFRKTLRKDAERIQEYMFDPVVRGIKWYSEFFGFNYPYEKYDQIYCPEFKFGAMENVGTVTFTENLLYRGKELTEADITRLVNVVLHELCHHWFGDLVTMTWWNDLWLNESFATYVSFLCMSKEEELAKQSPNLWVNVNSYKNWGYAEDDLETGHPICKQAPHTDSADDMINGITYGKGCSFLKQLYHLIGYDTFSEATKIYFKRHQWGNTILSDFLKCLDEANEKLPKVTEGIVVSEWASTFLNTRGANTFDASWEIDDLVITQEVSEFSDGLRQQKIDVLFFNDKLEMEVGSVLTSETDKRVRLLPSKPTKYFLLNHGDHAYGKIILSDFTIDFLQKNLSSLPDSLDRALVWRAVQGMVKTRQLKSTIYFDYVVNNIAKEDQSMVTESVLTTAGMLVGAYVPDSKFKDVSSDMFEVLYKQVLIEERNDLKKLFVNALFSFLHNDAHVKQAVAWLEAGHILNSHGNKIDGTDLSANQKHSIVKAIHKKTIFSAEEKQKFLDTVLGEDKSDVATNLRLSCEALLPCAETKEKVWAKITNVDSGLSSYERAAYMSCFFNRDSEKIVKPYFEKFIAHVRECANIGDRNYTAQFITNTCPSYAINDDFIQKMKDIVKDHKEDVKHESYSRTVNKVVGSLEIGKKIKDFALE